MARKELTRGEQERPLQAEGPARRGPEVRTWLVCKTMTRSGQRSGNEREGRGPDGAGFYHEKGFGFLFSVMESH